MTLQWLLGWWNLIFVTPFAVALLYLGVYTISGVGFGEADAHEAGGDADADADADADHDAGADAEHDADADADGHASGAVRGLAVSWLGVGRVPLTLVAIVLLLTWGAAGFMTNSLLRPVDGWEAARVSLPVALVASLLVTRGIVMLLGRFVPLNETYAKHRSELVGCVGEAVFGIDETFGMAAVRDERGELHQVTCRVGSGVAPIEKGRRVRLVAYRAAEGAYFVTEARAND